MSAALHLNLKGKISHRVTKRTEEETERRLAIESRLRRADIEEWFLHSVARRAQIARKKKPGYSGRNDKLLGTARKKRVPEKLGHSGRNDKWHKECPASEGQ